jgi:hypothetical protein
MNEYMVYICTCVSITDTKKHVAPAPAFDLYNLYRKPTSDLSHLSSREASSDSGEPSDQSPDNQSSTAEINQQIVGTESPGSGPQPQTLVQFTQGAPFTQQAQFPAGQGFNFGTQPGQFNFGFSSGRINQNINPQPAGTIEQGANAFQQNFPQFNFRRGSQLSSQYNVGQNGNSLQISSAQQNIPQYTGTLAAAGLPQQGQDLGQFNSFQFTSPNIGQGFSQQFSYPNFPAAGLYNAANQTLILAPSDGDQGSVVGFYGSVPNVGGVLNVGGVTNVGGVPSVGASSLNVAPLQGQTQNVFPNAGGLLASNFGQYTNGNAPLDTGASQLGAAGGQTPNSFSGFSLNPPAFQNGGAVQETGFSRRVSDEKPPPVAVQVQPILQPRQ